MALSGDDEPEVDASGLAVDDGTTLAELLAEALGEGIALGDCGGVVLADVVTRDDVTVVF